MSWLGAHGGPRADCGSDAGSEASGSAGVLSVFSTAGALTVTGSGATAAALLAGGAIVVDPSVTALIAPGTPSAASGLPAAVSTGCNAAAPTSTARTSRLVAGGSAAGATSFA